MVLEIEDIMINQTQNDKQAQLQLEMDLKQQLGLLGGESKELMGPGGLSIIEDENDSNQDSDFSGGNEDKVEDKPNTTENPVSGEHDIFDGLPIPL